MKQKLKKIFFYILGSSISFLGVFKSEAYIAEVRPLYGVQQTKTEFIENIILWIIGFFGYIISPIIFLIGLYFFITKKTDKKRKEKGIKYMERAIILVVIVFVLNKIIKDFFSLMIDNGGLEIPKIQIITHTVFVILQLLLINVVPTIFLIGLYFFITKKLNKKRKEKGIKYMIIAVVLGVITFLGCKILLFF